MIVCIGKDCRRSKGFDALVSAASEIPGSQQITCQSVCDGPVAGLRINGRISWYRHVRGERTRAAVLDAAAIGRAGKRLRKHEVRKKRDQVRHENQLRALRAPHR